MGLTERILTMRGLLARLVSLALCVAVLVNAEGSLPEESVVPEVLVQVKAQVNAKHGVPNIPFQDVLGGRGKKDPTFESQLEGVATPDPATQEILTTALTQVSADSEDPIFKDKPDPAFSPAPAGGLVGPTHKDPAFNEVMLEEEADASGSNPDEGVGNNIDPGSDHRKKGHGKTDPAFVPGINTMEVSSTKKGAKKPIMKEPPVPQKKPAKKPTKKAAKKNPAKKAAKKKAAPKKKGCKKKAPEKKASKKKAAKKKAAKKKDDEELLETDVSNTDFVFKKSIDPSFGEVLNGKASKDPAFDEELVQDVSGELNVGRDQTNWKDMDDIEFKDILDGNKKDSQDIAFARKSTAHKAVTLLQQPT